MKKIATSLATLAMMLNMSVVPMTAYASSTELVISGNGADSSNTSSVTSQSNTAVTQTNNTNITNNVNANSSTGNNSSSENTGGNATVGTGASSTVVGVTNVANSNTAVVEDCNCAVDANISITGNGSDSENNAELNLNSGHNVTTQVNQQNSGSIENKVNANSESGYNTANKNTGGSVQVTTGNSSTEVGVSTTANSNWASVGVGSQGNGEVSLWITGNGDDSENDIELDLDHDVLLNQQNSAYVENDVDAYSSTGDNRANRNTGGAVSVGTGDAHTEVVVDNAANFNAAAIDCDCLTDISATIDDNGADSENSIKAYLSDDLNVFQDNSCEDNILTFGWDGWYGHHNCGIDNDLDADSTSGSNVADKNVGDDEDSSEMGVTTGDAETLVGVENTGNSNSYGVETPETEGFGGLNVNISFDLSDLLGALGIL